MKRLAFYIVTVLLVFSCKTDNESNYNSQSIEKASRQLKYISENTNNASDKIRFPRTINESGSLKLVNKRDWTSGFYPGVLWLMYELTKDTDWKEKATLYTNALESEQFNASNHDIGFKMMCSFGLGYKLTKNESYKKVLIQSARTLTTRFNEKVGCIRSWDHNKDKWEFPVIIDNLMNLELLFWAWKETGDPVFYNIAVSHAKTTMKNHFRNDYSSYHVVGYDADTGEVISKNTHQGYSDNSSWSRGQAWALYGYTMIYRETNDPIFLKHAENVANYIINIAKLPEDFVPLWDFDLQDLKTESRDASAAAIIASALYELSMLTEQDNKQYLNVANGIMGALSSDSYFNVKGANKGFLLKHSTGSKPKNSEVDVPLIYADYYYLEALSRKIEINN
tara:strand:- start:34442 stop:35626 length:1185 start_codon:yes stop_codon:yes gene_type:complete